MLVTRHGSASTTSCSGRSVARRQEGAFRQDKTESGSSVSRSGSTEGVPDQGRTFDAGSRSHVDIETPEILAGADHRIHEREEFDIDRAECRTQDAEFLGPQILGTGVLCHGSWPGRGSDPGLYQKPGAGRSATGAV